MAKAINWPKQFRDEVIAEDTEKTFCAFRVGRLYYDNQFWVPGEEVDIRVNSLVVRKGVVEGELKCCPVTELSDEDFAKQKSGLKSVDAVVSFLNETYGEYIPESVTPETELTVVYYKNRAIDPEIMDEQDDPHM